MKIKALKDGSDHYKQGKIELIEVIHDWKLDFFLGNVVKYICRCERSEQMIEDLKKARHYLEMKIQFVEGEDKPVTHTHLTEKDKRRILKRLQLRWKKERGIK